MQLWIGKKKTNLQDLFKKKTQQTKMIINSFTNTTVHNRAQTRTKRLHLNLLYFSSTSETSFVVKGSNRYCCVATSNINVFNGNW